MKARSLRVRLATLILLGPFSFPTLCQAVALEHDVRIAPGERTLTKRKARRIHFLAWKGNRLLTTAGVHIIDESVEVIDTARSRELEPGFAGAMPSVQLIYEKKKLKKVIIE